MSPELSPRPVTRPGHRPGHRLLSSLYEPPDEHSRNIGAYLGPPVADVHCQAPSLTHLGRPSYRLDTVSADFHSANRPPVWGKTYCQRGCGPLAKASWSWFTTCVTGKLAPADLSRFPMSYMDMSHLP